MPTADAHVHFFRDGYAGTLGPPADARDDLAAYEQLRRHHGIARSLVIGYEAEPRYRDNNAHVLERARTRPWMAVAAYLPVEPPPTPDALRALRADGAVGFAIYLPDPVSADALRAWPVETLAELREQRAVVSLNVRPEAAERIAGVIDALEGCAILVSHLGLPGPFPEPPTAGQARERLSALIVLSARAHVAVKLSGLYAISDPAHDYPHAAAQPFVDVVLEAFGPARLLWGSDYTPALDFVSFAQTADARILAACSPGELEDVMGGNLLRLLGGE